MDLTHITQLHAIHGDLGATAGMEGGVVGYGGVDSLLHTQRGEQRLQLTLHSKEAFLGAVCAQQQHLGFCGKCIALLRQIDLCYLIELGGLVVIGVVAAQDLQHGGDSDGTHNGSVLAQGVLNPQRIANGGLCRDANVVENSRGNEGVGDDLTVAHSPALLAQLGLNNHFLAVAALGSGLESGGGDLIVAVESCHFFGNIGHQVQVGAERRNMNGATLHFNLQALQVADHILFGNVGAQQLVDLLGLQLQGLGLGNIVQHINGAIQHITGTQHLNQFAGALYSRQGHHRIDVLFELAGSIGTHTQRQSGLTNGSAVEVGGFKDHHSGVVHNFGVFAAHNTGQTDGAILVCDYQHTGLQISQIAIQGGQGFAFDSFPNDDLTGGNIAVVKCMHRLTVLQHHIVGNINDIVDGTDTIGTQALTQPLGGGSDLNIGYHPGSVTAAQLFSGYFHIQMLVDRAGIAALDNGLVVTHRLVESSCSLAG